MGDGGADALGFVTDDGEDVGGRDDARSGGDHMRQQRLAADFVQNLGKLRLKPRAFARGHDGDGDAGGIEGNLAWVAWISSFASLYLEEEPDRKGSGTSLTV